MKNEKQIIIGCKKIQNNIKINKYNITNKKNKNNTSENNENNGSENNKNINRKFIIEKKREKRKNKISCVYLNNINNQNKIIQKLYFNIDFPNKKIIISELKKKINSYKSQDIKKKRYKPNNFIKYDEVIEKILISKLKCKYCFSKLLLIYEKSREPKQWTLDRINNDLQHTNENTLICCLECNLKRRRTNKDKFLFTKQMNICKSY